MADVFAYDSDYQALVIAECLRNPQFKDLVKSTVTAEQFSNHPLQWFFETITGAELSLTKASLKEEMMKAKAQKKIKKEEAPVYIELYKQITKAPLPEESEHLKQTLNKFIRTQNVKRALLSTFDMVKEGKWEEIETIISEAVGSGVDVLSLGHDYFTEYEQRLHDRETSQARVALSTGIPACDELLNGGLKNKQVGLIVGGSGRGKCQKIDTPILMYDGSIKKVQDIVVGDLLMGPDSKPKTVLALGGGFGDIYTIHPTKGDPWGCNLDHVLTLVNSNGRHGNKGDIIDISLREYLEKSQTFKNNFKLFSVGVNFHEHQDLFPVDPYFLGIWLGDGDKTFKHVAITKGDVEIKNECIEQAKKWSLVYREEVLKTSKCSRHYINGGYKSIKPNPLAAALKTCVNEDWSISRRYLTGSREERLALLAGLLDTDGYVHYGSFEITQKHKPLAESIVFLARSLGFKVTMTESYKKPGKDKEFCGPYYRCVISGDCSVIPTRIPRKKAPVRKQIKDALRTGFTVTKGEPEQYYGFTLDGDGRYLLGDFTVTHNTVFLQWLCYVSVLLGNTAIYVTLELPAEDIAQRFDAQMSNITPHKLKEHRPEVASVFDKLNHKYNKKLFIKEFSPGSTPVSALQSYYKNLHSQGVHADVVIVDYLDLIKPARRYDSPNAEMYATFVALSAFAKECNTRIWTATQLNRGGLVAENPDETHIAGAIDKLFAADVTIMMGQTKEEKLDNELRLIFVKNRNGLAGRQVRIETDFEHMRFFKKVIADNEKVEKKEKKSEELEADVDVDLGYSDD